MEWKDVTPCDKCPELQEIFLKFGNKVSDMKSKLDKGGFIFNLTTEQFSNLNTRFRDRTEVIKPFEGEEARSAVNRLGVIAYRICMILTILREMEILPVMVCSSAQTRISKRQWI